MLKFNRVICALLVCACVGVAFGAVRITDFMISNEEGANPDAMAILAYASGRDITNVQIIVSDFTPNTLYDVDLVDSEGGRCFANFGVLFTNTEGHGNAHLKLNGDVTSCNVEIWVDLDEGAANLRAKGQ